MLLKSGMTVRQAILYNALSAMMAYLGLMTGILIGHYAENISMWIFALTAGLFMYVALVDMVSPPPPLPPPPLPLWLLTLMWEVKGQALGFAVRLPMPLAPPTGL